MLPPYLLRALVIWIIIIVAETFQGIARLRFLVRRMGDLRSRQLGVLTGSAVILIITWASLPWIDATNTVERLSVGILWCILTVLFDVLLGRFVARYPWKRILADFNVLKGGLLPLGLIVMMFAPLIMASIG
jgi:hypothetical protein